MSTGSTGNLLCLYQVFQAVTEVRIVGQLYNGQAVLDSTRANPLNLVPD